MLNVHRLRMAGAALPQRGAGAPAELPPGLEGLRRTFDPDYDAERARELGETMTAAQRQRLGLVLSGSLGALAHVMYGCYDCGAIVSGPESTCRKCGYSHGGANHRAIARS